VRFRRGSARASLRCADSLVGEDQALLQRADHTDQLDVLAVQAFDQPDQVRQGWRHRGHGVTVAIVTVAGG
jgi:ABC-type thiamine transport system substrate-binding protein